MASRIAITFWAHGSFWPLVFITVPLVLAVAYMAFRVWVRGLRRLALDESQVAEDSEELDHLFTSVPGSFGPPDPDDPDRVGRTPGGTPTADVFDPHPLDSPSGEDEESEDEDEKEVNPDAGVVPPIPPPVGPPPVETRALGTPTDQPLSDGYVEVEDLRQRAQSIEWEPITPAPRETELGGMAPEERLLIEALYELRVISGSQIERGILSIGERQARRRLARLRDMGMVQRGWVYGARIRGHGKPVYALARNGFLLLCGDPDHPASGKWNRSPRRSAQHVVHDLSRNEWLFAFRSLASRQLLGFRGTGRGRIKREKSPSIVPDLTLELQLESPKGGQIEVDLLIEIEWRNNRERVLDKAIAYDRLLSGWWREHPRYEALGRPPKVCFVVPDLQRARRYLANLDATLQEHFVIPPHTQTRRENELGIVSTAKNVYVGRRRVFVAVAADAHQRTLRAWQVPDKPPSERVDEARSEEEKREAARAIPRRVQLLDPSDLVDPAA